MTHSSLDETYQWITFRLAWVDCILNNGVELGDFEIVFPKSRIRCDRINVEISPGTLASKKAGAIGAMAGIHIIQKRLP